VTASTQDLYDGPGESPADRVYTAMGGD